jgi:hypothetical protein
MTAGEIEELKIPDPPKVEEGGRSYTLEEFDSMFGEFIPKDAEKSAAVRQANHRRSSHGVDGGMKCKRQYGRVLPFGTNVSISYESREHVRMHNFFVLFSKQN